MESSMHLAKSDQDDVADNGQESNISAFVAMLYAIGVLVLIFVAALVIQDNDKPLAVLLKYEHFIAMQEMIRGKE